MADKRTHVGVVTYKKVFDDGGVSFKVEGLEGYCAFSRDFEGRRPTFAKGQKVQIEFNTSKGKNYVSRMRVSSEPPPAGSNGSDQRDDAINYNVAVTRAIETAGLLIANGCVKLGAANNPDARKMQVLGLVDALTAKYYSDITTRAPIKAAAAVQAELGDEGDDGADELDEAPPARSGKVAQSDGGPDWDDDIPF